MSVKTKKGSARMVTALVITPAVALYVALFSPLDSANPQVTYTFCVGLVMAVWWITEVVPLAVTSLLPVPLFPLFGILDGKVVASAYFNDVIFLFMGGFLVALAMQRWNLHRRIALHILMITGVSAARILLGFMVASAFLSMWISNTATAMMMLPIALSIISQLESLAEDGKGTRFSTGMLLGIAYGASIGGTATLVGTPPNLSFVRIFHICFPEAPEIPFSQWLLFALPTALLVFMTAWLILWLMFRPNKEGWKGISRQYIRRLLVKQGKVSYQEKVVGVVFVLLALLWIFRSDLDFGTLVIPGWAGFLPYGHMLNDGSVAIFMAIVLFVIPSKTGKGSSILDWKTASALPWHILLLFGGGFALASGFKESGLSAWFGEQLIGVASFHPFVVILCIALIMTFLTELTSNTATTEMILPILAGIAVTTQINPLLLMIPATLSASMAFMLPVATPPNAIIFGTSRVTIAQMARTGLALNLAGALIITSMMYFWGRVVFGI
jgi:solute carrier family 13 (sodium-dependent dicarboxylate transporter), member 2/3/5